MSEQPRQLARDPRREVRRHRFRRCVARPSRQRFDPHECTHERLSSAPLSAIFRRNRRASAVASPSVVHQ
jgi:hypothetical protein